MNPTTPSGNTDKFFGQKVSKPGIDVNTASDNQLIYKNDFSTQTFYTASGQAGVASGQIPSGGTGTAIYDSAGNIVAQYGEQSDGSVNLKFFDSNGIGVAQFGQFTGGAVALKVAFPNVEVSSAPDSELIFNSNQNIFKIVQSGVVALNGANSVSTNTTTITIPGYNNSPAFLAYLQLSNISTQLPSFNLTVQSGYAGIGYIIYGNAYQSGTDGKLDLSATNYTIANDPNTYTIKYYILQETIT